MSLHQQLRWGGLWIIVSAILMNGMNIVVYSGYHNAAIQAIYGIGFTGLILSATIIHIAQAGRAGTFGSMAYLVSVLSLVYSNVVTFLILADLAGIEAAQQALNAIWNPVMRIAVYCIFIGWTLLGISIAISGVFPGWAGILIALGVAIQLPAQYSMEIAGPLFFLFTIGGSLLLGMGLIWVGWVLWSNNRWQPEENLLSDVDRTWGAPFVLISVLLFLLDAFLNSFAELTLLDGIIHVLSTTALILMIVILHTAQAEKAGGAGLAGFFFTHLGATLSIIPAYLIMAQLAGQIPDNRALMASWVDIPVGRYGSYLVLLGLFLFGLSVIRAEVFPRWTGWLVTIGMALLLPSQVQSQDYLFSIFWVIGAILGGVGFGWMGWTLMKKSESRRGMRLTEEST